MLFQRVVRVLAIATCVVAAPISRDPRIWIWRYVNYKKVDILDPRNGIPAGITGELYKTYQPLLSVVTRRGCSPYNAVDAAGGLGSGVDQSFSTNPNDNCRPVNDGQLYVRSGNVNGAYGIMYAWYFPKSESQFPFDRNEEPDKLWYKHDWANIVVWLDGVKESAQLRGIAYSNARGKGYSSLPHGPETFKDKRPVVDYTWQDAEKKLPHMLRPTKADSPVIDSPMAAWENLPWDAWWALNNARIYKDVPMPMTDSNFQKNLQAAYDSQKFS